MSYPHNNSVAPLLARSDIWQASSLVKKNAAQSTGFADLDQALHQGGWPQQAVVELLCQRLGGAELLLFTQGLARLSTQTHGLILIAPPYIPYAPALLAQGLALDSILIIKPRTMADLIWCTEQAFQTCGYHVISWLSDARIPYRQLRKLQLASQGANGLSVLVRSLAYSTQAAPSPLRLTCRASLTHLHLQILKQPGGWGGQEVRLPLTSALTQVQQKPQALPVYQRQQALTTPAQSVPKGAPPLLPVTSLLRNSLSGLS